MARFSNLNESIEFVQNFAFLRNQSPGYWFNLEEKMSGMRSTEIRADAMVFNKAIGILSVSWLRNYRTIKNTFGLPVVGFVPKNHQLQEKMMKHKHGRVIAFFAAIGVSLLLNGVALAQPGGGDGGGRQAMRGMGGMFDSSLGMLMRGEVRDELGLAEDQVAQLEELQSKSRDIMRDMFQRGRDNGEGFDFQKMREEIQEKMKEVEEEAGGILLPHQVERLEQIVLQSRQRRGTTGALESIAEKLNITDAQLEELKAKSEEAQKKYEEQVAKAREQMQEDILSVLDSDQRAKYKELVGDSFDFNNNRGGQGGNRRGADRGNNNDEGDGNRPRRSDF